MDRLSFDDISVDDTAPPDAPSPVERSPGPRPPPTARLSFDDITPEDDLVSSPAVRPGDKPTWTDLGRYVVGGAGNTLSSTGAGLEYFLGKGAVGDWLQATGKGISDDQLKQLSPAGRKALTDDLWGADDVVSTLTAKTLSAIPSLATSIIPGVGAGRLALAAGAGMRGAAAAGFGASAGVGSVQSAGGVFEQIGEGIAKAPEDQLRKASEAYVRFRDSGLDDAAARRALIREASGYKPALAAAVTAITSKFGIEGMVANRIAGNVAAAGILRGVAIGAAGESFQETVESAAQEYLAQKGLIDAGTQKEIDWGKIAKQGFEGGVVGGVLGGATGGVAHRRSADPNELHSPAARTTPPTPTGDGPALDEQAALQSALGGAPQGVQPAPVTEELEADEVDDEFSAIPGMREALRGPAPAPAQPGAALPTTLPTTAPPTQDAQEERKAQEAAAEITPPNFGNNADVTAALVAAQQPGATVGSVLDATGGRAVSIPAPPRALVAPGPQIQPATQPQIPPSQPVSAAPAPVAEPEVELRSTGYSQSNPPLDEPTQPAPALVEPPPPEALSTFVQPAPEPDVEAIFEPEPAPVEEPLTPRQRETERQLMSAAEAELAARPSHPREENRGAVREAVSRASVEFRPRVRESQEAPGAAARAMRDEFIQAVRRHTIDLEIAGQRDAIIQEKVVGEDQMKRAQELAREREVERTGREKGKSAKGVEDESERSHIRAARAAVAKDGEQAPAWARLTVEAVEERATKGRGRGAKAEAVRAKTNAEIKVAREARAKAAAEQQAGKPTTLSDREAARRKQAAQDAAAREERVKRVFSDRPSRTTARSMESDSSVRARVADILTTLKNEKIELPPALSHDHSPFVNLAIMARMVRQSKLSPTDYAISEMLINAGQAETALSAVIQPVERSGDHSTFDTIDKALSAAPVPKPPKAAPGAAVSTQTYSADELAAKMQRAEVRNQSVVNAMKAKADDPFLMPAPRGWDMVEPIENPRVTGIVGGQVYSAADMMKRVEKTISEGVETYKPTRGTPGYALDYLNKQLRSRLDALVGNVPVQVIDSAEIELRSGRKASGLYFPGSHSIFLNADLLGDPLRMRKVLQHEMAHAATVWAYETNTNNAKQMFDALYMAMGDAAPVSDQYGMSNVQEFLAEAFSNPRFQNLLASTPLPRDLAAQMRAITAERVPTWWDYFVASVQNLLNMAGFGRRGMTFLDAVLKLAPDVAIPNEQTQFLMSEAQRGMLAFPGMVSEEDPFGVLPMLEPVKKAQAAAMIRAEDAALNFAPGARRKIFWMMSTAQIGRKARDLFTGVGDDNVFEKLTRMFLATGPQVRQIMLPGDELMLDLDRFRKNNMPVAERLSDIMHDATVHQYDPTVDIAHANNKHLGKKSMRWAQARQMHAAARKEFLALPQEAQDLAAKLRDFYRDVQDRMMRTTIERILAGADERERLDFPQGETLETVRDWVLSGRIDITDETRLDPRDKAIKAMLGGLGRQLADTLDMRLVKGLYVPLMRRGEFVVSASVKVDAPPGGVVVDGNKIVFQNKKDAENFLGSTKEHIQSVKSVWVDEQTGARVFKVDAAGKSAQRFIVTVQNKLVQFFDTPAEAEREKQKLKKDGVYTHVTEVAHRGEHASIREILPSQVNKLIASIDAKSLPTATKTLARNAIIDTAFRSMAGTRVQHRRLLRNNVLGFSRDLVLALRDYNVSTSNYLGRMMNMHKMEKQIDLIRDYIKVNEAVGGRAHDHMRRQEMLTELEARIHSTEDYFAGNWVTRLTTLSYLAHLMSPAFSLINSLQVGMVTMPYLSGTFGVGNTMRELTRAYNAIGGGREFIGGLSDSATAFKEIKTGPTKRTAPHSAVRILDRVKSQPDAELLTKALQKAIDFGLVDNDAGLEIERSEIGKGTSDVYLGRVANFARALPQHIEAINRTVTIVAAVRLAKAAGKTETQAIQAAIDAVEATQGDYSSRGTARVFNSRPARIMLQFKKYPQMMAHLIARNTLVAFKGASPDERKAARKMLLTLGLTTVAMAGAAGLPWEIGRMLVMAAWARGLADDWDQYEANVQRKVQAIIGNTGAEALMYGLPRLIGIDVSNRVGLESMILFGSPKDAKANDVKAWLWDTIAGAPGGVVSDGLKAIGAGVAGEHGEMAKNLPFPKVVKDTIKALQGYSEGKVSKTGKPLAKPLTLGEAATKAFGLRPASEARQFEAGGAGREKKEERARAAESLALKNAWVKAEPGAAREKQWRKIQEWNKSHPDDRVSMGDLRRLEQRRKRENTKAKRELEDA